MGFEDFRRHSVVLRYGAMNSGKSTGLLQAAFNYEERGQRVLLTKPGVDTKGDSDLGNDEFIDGSWSLLRDAGSHPGFYLDFCAELTAYFLG